MKSTDQNKINKLKKAEILPLLATSAVIKNYGLLKKLISIADKNEIGFKKIYEALLQNYLFAGYPSALVSLKILKEFFPKKKLGKAVDMNLYHVMNEGVSNCKKFYGDKFEKLILNIKDFSPDLAEWLILEGYGKVLGRKGLSFKERELCVVSILTALKFNDQLYSHINGALRAGSKYSEINQVINNLSVTGNQELTEFGLSVLRRFKKE